MQGLRAFAFPGFASSIHPGYLLVSIPGKRDIPGRYSVQSQSYFFDF
jgi:hypothetical protein